jgi:hypothetical protein
MISKTTPPLSGPTGLIIGCTIDGIARTLLLVPISTYTKSKVCIWSHGKWFNRHATQVYNSVHQSEPTPYYPKSTLLWTLEQFATTPSTWVSISQGLVLHFKYGIV